MLQRNAQKGYHAMVRPEQVKKMHRVMEKIGLLQEYNDEMTKFNQIENFDKNEEHTALDLFLEKAKKKPNFQKELYAETINEAQFNERFYSASAFTLVNNAKL
jgi:hypothetical protein